METRTCKQCGTDFGMGPDDFAFYQKIKVPLPTLCPECRMIRRFCFFNERTLFKRKDDAGGGDIFSGIPPEVVAPVYNRDYWWGDAWDSMMYGREYDFSQSFFEQFRDLMHAVPWPSRDVANLVNSDYCNDAAGLKNCYLCFNIAEAQDSGYVNDAIQIRNSFDLTDAGGTELCYESIGIILSYRAFFSLYCNECRDVWFCRDCVSCSDCFGCVNLKNKKYHIFNKPYSAEEYGKKLKEFRLDTFSGLQEADRMAKKFWAGYPHKYYHGWHNVNVSGELIEGSKNTFFAYAGGQLESSKFIQFSSDVRDSYDFSGFGDHGEFLYESLIVGNQCSNVKFCYSCVPSVRDTEYSMFCGSSSNLFGCVGLRKKQYCILNRQYTREDYFSLREKIIQHMNEMPYLSDHKPRTTNHEPVAYRYGEFFPPALSPFAYNDTIAQDFFPLTQEEAKKRGYRWRNSENGDYTPTIRAADLPEHIENVADDITNAIVQCSACGRAYGIIPMELAFYRNAGLPLPRACASCRFLRRMREKNPPRYWRRRCQCAGMQSENGKYQNAVDHFHGTEHCPNEFDTTYDPAKPDIVYCESCSNAETA